MDKIKDFFNKKAENWDNESFANPKKIKTILSLSELKENSKILDIACGTGVLENFLLDYSPSEILGIDISEKMIEKAREKFSDDRITFICEDFYNLKNQIFDYIIIYNAFPHFLEQERMISHLYTLLAPHGKFVICHGMGRKNIDEHHRKVASEISLGLQPAISNALMLKDKFHIKALIDTEELYLIYSQKKELH